MNVRLLAHVGMALGALFCAFFAFSPAVDTGFSGADFDFLEHTLAAGTATATRATARSPLNVPPSIVPRATSFVWYVKSHPSFRAAAASVTIFSVDAGMKSLSALNE